MVLKIFRAVDAFLYLPTYVAQELDILGTLLRPWGITEVLFDPPKSNKSNGGGDIGAIKSMYYSSTEEEGTISIAVCSPSSLLSRDIDPIMSSNCRIIAGIIDKLPFWGINHRNKEFENINEIEDTFDNVIYYKKELIEGHCLGESLRNSPKINTGTTVDWGDEFDLLEKNNNTAHMTIAISADIVKIVKVTGRKENPLQINYRFSKDRQYLTTGLITTKESCEKYQDILSKIVEAIQKSIAILYSSEKIAIEICDKVRIRFSKDLERKLKAKNPEFNQRQLNYLIEKDIPTSEELKAIVKMITEEQFYPADLNINIGEWKGAATALSIAETWSIRLSSDEIVKKINNSFAELVDNSFILKSERSIANQFGIDTDTFGDKIFEIVNKETWPLKEKLNKCEAENVKLKNRLFLLRILNKLKTYSRQIFILSAIAMSLGGAYLIYKYWVQEPITKKEIYILVLGLITAIIGPMIYDLFKRKK